MTGPFVRCLNARQRRGESAFKQANGFSAVPELISNFWANSFAERRPTSSLFLHRRHPSHIRHSFQTKPRTKKCGEPETSVRRPPFRPLPGLSGVCPGQRQRQRGKKCQARNQTRFCPRCLFSSLHRRGTIHLNMHAGY